MAARPSQCFTAEYTGDKRVSCLQEQHHYDQPTLVLLFEIDTDQEIRNWLHNNEDEIRTLLQNRAIPYKDIQVSQQNLVITFDQRQVMLNAMHMLNLEGFPTTEVTASDGYGQLLLHPQTTEQYSHAVISRYIEVLAYRLNQMGIADATVEQQSQNLIAVSMPGVNHYDEQFIAPLGMQSILEFRLVDEQHSPMSEPLKTLDGETFFVQRKILLTQENLTDAQFTPYTEFAAITLTFDTSGRHIFSAITLENVGKQLAIVFNDNNALSPRILSAAYITAPIETGEVMISGSNMTIKEMQEMALTIRTSIPLPPISLVDWCIAGANPAQP